MNFFNIIKYILILLFIKINVINAAEKSRYWTDLKIGPKSNLETINKFFMNKDLHPIEGIWLQENFGTVAIVKDKELKMIYRKYIIDHLNNPKLNGTISASLNRIKDVDKFVIFEKITDDNKSFTSMGFLTMYVNENKKNPTAKSSEEKQLLMKKLKLSKNAEVHIFSSNKKENLNIRYKLKRIYP